MRPTFLPTGIMIHRRRYLEILRIVSRYGLGSLLDQLGLRTLAPFEHRPFRRPVEQLHLSPPERLRLVLEALGTTYIKLGQILSTREDLLPPAYVRELGKLRDQVPPVPYSDLVPVIEESLGKPLAELYRSVSEQPLAAASIGQVHLAELHDGTTVVVKVQKPGIAALVEEDLQILTQLARFAQRHAPLAESYDLVALVDEFGWTLRSELDYLREGRNADQFRRNFEKNRDVVIPRVYWDLTSARVITLEYLPGITIDDVAALDGAGINRASLAERAARAILDEVFVHHFFHADPHPGNLAVLPNGQLAVYDFGMVGRIDEPTAEALLGLALGVVRRDPEVMVDSMAGLYVIRRGADRIGLQRDIQHLMDRYMGLSLQEYRFDQIVEEVLQIVRRRRLQMPAELSLLLKTLAMMEGVGRKLDPNFRPIELAAPYLQHAMVEQRMPWNWGPKLVLSGDDALRLLLRLPRRVDRLLLRAEQGDLEISMRLLGLLDVASELQGMVNRLIIALVVSASFISLGLLLTVYHPDWLLRWVAPVFAIGLLATLLAAAFLTGRLLRSPRRRQ